MIKKDIVKAYFESPFSVDMINDLAKPLGFDVLVIDSDMDLVSIKLQDNDKKKILINKAKLNDDGLWKFILAYNLSEIINDEMVFNKPLKLEEMKKDNVQVAKLICEKEKAKTKKLVNKNN